MAAPPVPFALTPAQATGGDILDKAVAKLSDEPFDCSPEGLFQFLRSLEDRAYKYGWNDEATGIMMIPTDPDNPDVLSNLLTNYGEVKMEEVRAFEMTYISTQSRAAQDTHMLYACIMNSLSKEGKPKFMYGAISTQRQVVTSQGTYC